MRAAVLDASIIGPWLWTPVQRTSPALHADYDAGRLVVHIPTLLYVEVLNVAGRQLRWTEAGLRELADSLTQSRFEVMDPNLQGIATWVARGLTAYDASYVALAEQLGVPLMTTDRLILDRAAGVADLPG